MKQNGQLPIERDDKQPAALKDRWRSARAKKHKH
tara:strand:+ start:268 stop:369 length:102 start_codon:yes stop_codon:yes gene_type:complete